MPGGRPRKFKSPEEMQEKIDAYFLECDEKKKPYVITGLALALDCDRDTLLNYENDADKAEFFGTIKKAKAKCHNYAEEFLYTGKNPVGAIFNLKNNWGWRDKQEHEHTGKDGGPLEVLQLSAEERRARIDALLKKREEG